MRDDQQTTAQDAPDSQSTALTATGPLTHEQLHSALLQLPDTPIDADTGLRHTQAEAQLLSTEHRQLAILDALTRGVAYRRIAETYRCSTSTLTGYAKRLANLESGAVANLMQMQALEALDEWRLARKVAAAEGKHAPARDWLTFSKALEQPASDAQSGAKVTIIIGQPGRPAGGMTPEVLIAQAVTVNESTGQVDT